MKKQKSPPPPQTPPRRISLREIALAVLALGCSFAWLYERNNNQATAEGQQFVEALKQLRQNPDSVVEVVINKGPFPIACRMRRFETGPLPEPNTDSQLPDEVTSPVVKPGDTSEPKKPAEPKRPADTVKSPAAPQQPVAQPDKPDEPEKQPAESAPDKSP
jgi:hypothetical protein